MCRVYYEINEFLENNATSAMHLISHLSSKEMLQS